MQYMLLFTETEADFAKREDPAEAPAYWAAWNAYCKLAGESGAMVSGAALQPASTATTVRIRDGKQTVHDGPFAESKELAAGFFILDLPDLDAAIEWAAKCPAAASSSVEIRPVLPKG